MDKFGAGVLVTIFWLLFLGWAIHGLIVTDNAVSAVKWGVLVIVLTMMALGPSKN